MATQSARFLALVTLLFVPAMVGVLMANSVFGVEQKTGSSQSPLSWHSVEGVETALDRSAALASARQAIGGLDQEAAPAWIKLAILTDKHPFGEVFADRPVWLVKFPAVRVPVVRVVVREHRPEVLEVTITGIVDANDGRLLAAFTAAQETWYNPQIAQSNNPEAAAAREGWSTSPCTALRKRSTVANYSTGQSVDCTMFLAPWWWPPVELPSFPTRSLSSARGGI